MPARVRWRLAFALSIGSVTDAVFAHSEAAGSGLMAGLVHPVTGMDHLFAMLAVGILSVRLGGSNIWRIPAAFVLAMSVGAWIGFQGWWVPPYESGISWSVLLLGIAIAHDSARRMLGALFIFVALFGLCHGYAHGLELPASVSVVSYVTGLLVATVFIHTVGIFIGELASSSRLHTMVLRAAGAGMALMGAWLVFYR